MTMTTLFKNLLVAACIAALIVGRKYRYAPRIIPAEQLRPLAKARPRPRAERASV